VAADEIAAAQKAEGERADSLQRISTAVAALEKLKSKDEWAALSTLTASKGRASDALAALIRLDKEERRVLKAAIELGESTERGRADLAPEETRLWEWLDALGSASGESDLDENPADAAG
jgi:hypothetical protein